RHLRPALGLALVGALSLTACEPAVEGSPQQVAEALAVALETGEFDGVPMVDGIPADAEAQRTEAYERLGEVPVDVEVLSVESPDDKTATAKLELTFDLPGEGDDLVRQ